MGLQSVDATLDNNVLMEVKNNISRITSVNPLYYEIEHEFFKRIKLNGYNREYLSFKILLNKFLSVSKLVLTGSDLKLYAEVTYVIVMRKRANELRYFENKKQLLSFTRAFLTQIQYQTIILP